MLLWALVLGTFLVVLSALAVVLIYNRFKQLRNASEATLNQIKVALKKRLDMISQLVESVKNYAKFEKEVLEKITEMRMGVTKVTKAEEIRKIDRESRKFLGMIRVTVENYPKLKTSRTVKELMRAVREVEDEIARHRYTYNNIVQEYNTKMDTIPSNLVAKLFGLERMGYLEFEKEIRKKPELKW